MFFRTHTTNLTDDELILLDVMFDFAVGCAMLRLCNFGPQFAVEPHSLDDASLDDTIRRFIHDDIVTPFHHHRSGRAYIKLTKHGGAQWASERRPDWNRYCSYRECATIQDKTIVSVQCVSEDVRDDYLRHAFPNPIRTKTATVRDAGLIQWKPFARLYVGLASFREPINPSAAEFEEWMEDLRKHEMIIEPRRTWWHTVRELQKFTGTAENAG